MASGVFGLKKVYKKQVQNVTDNNFESWPEKDIELNYGYFAGGSTSPLPVTFCRIERFDFSTETIHQAGNNLPIARDRFSSVSSDYYGYFGGGNSPVSTLSQITTIEYSTDTVSIPSNLPDGGRRDLAAMSSSLYGYFGGGYTPSVTSKISRLDFSVETVSNPPYNLPSGRGRLTATSSSSRGYFAGGIAPPSLESSDIWRIDFSTDTDEVLDTNKNLTGGARHDLSTVQDSNYSFFAGGLLTPPGGVTAQTSNITRFEFSTETPSNTVGTNPLGGTRGEMSAVSSNSYGYFGGGYVIPPISLTSTITRIEFSTGTVSNPGVKMTSILRDGNGLSAKYGRASIYRANGFKTYGYFAGGFTPPFINTISRIDFSTDIFTNPGKNLPSVRGWTAAVSSNFYGYFGGGSQPGVLSTITRLDFSSETVSNPGKNLPSSRHNFAATSSNSYGYFGGSASPPLRSTITRLDFSNETVSDPGNNLPTSIGSLAAVSSNSYGYFCGGYTSTYINTVTRLDFSNETVSGPGNNLPAGRESLTAVSNNSYGYYAGGFLPPFINTISRIDFSNETVSDPGKNLPVSVSRLGGCSSSFYGYFAGGQRSPTTRTSSVSKIDFSTENISASPSLPSARNILTGLSNSN